MPKLLAALLLVLLFATPQAAEARRYAVLSLVGDKLLVVQREPSVGSHLDRNTRVFVDLPDDSIDRAVTLAVDDALRRADRASTPVLLAVRDPGLYAVSSTVSDRKDGVARVYEAVKPVLAGTNATHLVLVTKHRHRAMLRVSDGHVGTGVLEGVGFYVDHGSFTRSVDPNEAERGFISPFTYFRLALIDLATGRILAEEHVIGSDAVSPELRNVGNAWKALSDHEKVERLTRVIREEASRAVPKVLAQR